MVLDHKSRPESHKSVRHFGHPFPLHAALHCYALHHWTYGSLTNRVGDAMIYGFARVVMPGFQIVSIKGQRSSRGQVALGMPYGYQVWLEEPNL